MEEIKTIIAMTSLYFETRQALKTETDEYIKIETIDEGEKRVCMNWKKRDPTSTP